MLVRIWSITLRGWPSIIRGWRKLLKNKKHKNLKGHLSGKKISKKRLPKGGFWRLPWGKKTFPIFPLTPRSLMVNLLVNCPCIVWADNPISSNRSFTTANLPLNTSCTWKRRNLLLCFDSPWQIEHISLSAKVTFVILSQLCLSQWYGVYLCYSCVDDILTQLWLSTLLLEHEVVDSETSSSASDPSVQRWHLFFYHRYAYNSDVVNICVIAVLLTFVQNYDFQYYFLNMT